jgi:hypothetical protein
MLRQSVQTMEQELFPDGPRCVETVCKAACFEQWDSLSDEARHAIIGLADSDAEVRIEEGVSLYHDVSDEDRLLLVPCILAALRRGCFPDRAHALDILGSWGRGTLFEGFTVHELETLSVELPASLLEYQPAMRSALSKGVDFFLEFLNDPDFDIQHAAVYVLGKCFHDRKRLLPLIKQRIEQEANSYMRAELVFAFGNLAQGELEQAKVVLRLLESERDEAMRVALICAGVLIMGPNCSEELLSRFVELQFEPRDLGQVLGKEDDALPAALAQLSDDALRAVIPHLLELPNDMQIDRFDRRSIAYDLARVLFPPTYVGEIYSAPFFADGTTDKELTPVQIRFLEYMAKTADLWPSQEERQEGLGMSDVFKLPGFPETPEQLRRLLSRYQN